MRVRAPSVLEQLVWRAARSRRAVAAVAALLLAVCFLAAVISGSPLEPAIIAYAAPVSLAALALGAWVGMATAVVSAALYWLGAYLDDQTLSAGHISYRLIVLLFLGAVVGGLASRLAEAERDAEMRRELRSRAVELNDTVVQGLALSGYQLDGGDSAAAAGTVRTTLERAQKLVADLMGDIELQPGALRRSGRADLNGSD